VDWLVDSFAVAQQGLFETMVQPVMVALGESARIEEAYEGTGWLLVGLAQIAVMLLCIAPLQRWRPVEQISDPAAVRVDILYTLIHRLGLFRLAMFFSLDPVFDALVAAGREAGLNTLHIDQLWPDVTDVPWVSFLIYLVVFDALGYAIHRAQHHFDWWWQLHALHHSQRQMTVWSDNRNHLLDDVLVDVIWVVLAQLIGIAPGQFVAVVALTQLSESLQHANVRLWFGAVGERLWISPRFHRLHHSVGAGVRRGGHNFGVLLPWWDVWLGTADFRPTYEPTGIRDQVEQGVDYGASFWVQQKLGLVRLVEWVKSVRGQ
jgi:sterol desaturase/sphingolipid hydroxylase (fatty acid hydroxylase superfamily)